MATVTGFTADRMLQIEQESIVDARQENHELILSTRGGQDINVGNIQGPEGPQGEYEPHQHPISDIVDLSDDLEFLALKKYNVVKILDKSQVRPQEILEACRNATN